MPPISGNINMQKENQFWWMVGESSANLKPGRRVEALVRFVGQSEARCVLPELGNLEATLNSMDISSHGQVTPSDHLRVGQSVNARYNINISSTLLEARRLLGQTHQLGILLRNDSGMAILCAPKGVLNTCQLRWS